MNKTERVFPPWVWLAYALLFGLSIPWYLPARLEMKLMLGLPFWLVSAIAAIILIACFTVLVIYRYWKEEGTEPVNP